MLHGSKQIYDISSVENQVYNWSKIKRKQKKYGSLAKTAMEIYDKYY